MHESLTIALLQAREVAMGYFRPYLKQHNLTEQQWRIIRVLADDNSNAIDFHNLATRTCILRPSMTGILTRMERDGLIIRMKPLSDQRKLYISLTQQGIALYNDMRSQVENGYRAIEQEFSPQKMQQLRDLLDELIALGAQRKPETMTEENDILPD